MHEVELIVSGMTCAHCEHAVTAALTSVGGIEVLEATADTGLIRIAAVRPLRRDRLAAALAEAGYAVAAWPTGTSA